MTLEIVRADWDTAKAVSAAERAQRRAAERSGEVLLQAANRRVPRATGMLESTGRVAIDGGEAYVGYGTRYGRILRAHPEWNYQGGRSGRWLDEAVRESSDEVGRVMADATRAEWPGA